jgi:hypothetical protein
MEEGCKKEAREGEGCPEPAVDGHETEEMGHWVTRGSGQIVGSGGVGSAKESPGIAMPGLSTEEYFR